jgi:putative transposase
VVRLLEQIIEWLGKPKAIRCDNGPEYINQKLADQVEHHQIALIFIQPGNPQQNAYIERFNCTVKCDWLSHYIYEDIEQLQERATEWLWTYNNERLNMGIGGITPVQKRRLTNNLNSTTELH